jgi:hypothetical protein
MELNLALPGKKTGKETVSLSDESFDKVYNEPLVHQTVVTVSLGVNRVLAEHVLEPSDRQSGAAAVLPLLHVLRITRRNSIRKCIAVRCSAFFQS